MLSAEQNERITRIGATTPAGVLLRLYWQPAALVEELSGSRPLKALRLCGENFVLFRAENGRYGLLDRSCPHRGMRMCWVDSGSANSFTCPYHGWTFNTDGKLIGVPLERELYQGELDRGSGTRIQRIEL